MNMYIHIPGGIQCDMGKRLRYQFMTMLLCMYIYTHVLQLIAINTSIVYFISSGARRGPKRQLEEGITGGPRDASLTILLEEGHI